MRNWGMKGMALRYGLFCCMDDVNICDAAKTANLVLLFSQLFFSPKSLKQRRLFIKVSVYQTAVRHHGFKMYFFTNVPSLFFAILSVSYQIDTLSRLG